MSTHAFAVHFPVAFLVVSTILYGCWLVVRRELLATLFVVTASIGLVGLAAAVITGQFQVDAQITDGGFVEVFRQHENLAYYALSAFYGAFMWYIVRRKKMEYTEQWLLLVAQLVALGVVLYTAHIGGVLVYEHGAGVVPVRQLVP